MRNYTATAVIAAPPERVWPILADVLRWPEWLPTVSAVASLDTTPFAVGARYKITQPKLRPAIWTVVNLEANKSFIWESRAPGLRTLANHSLLATPGGETELALQIDFSGPMSFVAGALGGRLTKEYLATEAASIKQRAEAIS